MLKIVLYWAMYLVKESSHCLAFSIFFFFFKTLVQFFFLVFPFCLENHNILLSYSNYRPKFNFISIKKIQDGPKIFFKGK